jgi:hypothetical protein
MGYLKVYRDFYVINTVNTGQTYTLIDVEELTVDVVKRGETEIVETPIVTNESVGKYFVDLNPFLYTVDYIYEINWKVKYTSDSPLKLLKTRVQFKPTIVGDSMEIEIDNQEIELKIDNC